MGQDEKFMMLALSLAQKGKGRVSPNPLVGAVLVKGGKVIGRGWHQKFGGPHAEVNALRGKDARGAALYVTLEPCSHVGNGKKTPPCVPLVIKSGVKRVVIATKDPNPQVRGEGVRKLGEAGIEVKVGVLEKEAQEQNEVFFKFMETGMPFVCLKMAISADGKIGVLGKGNVRISGRQFDEHSQRLRNRYDAILVGINTVLADDPRLTCRMRGGRNPVRIVLDSKLRLPLSAKVLHNARLEKVIIATSQKYDRKKAEKLLGLGAKIIVCGKNEAELGQLLAALPSVGIISVLIEGGAGVAEAALHKELVDCVIVAKSGKKLGGKNAVPAPKRLLALLPRTGERMGKDIVFEGRRS